MTKPNIIWITSDEMKASSLSAYGHPWADTPTSQRVAENGVLFERAYAQFPKCVPSRCSFLTGRYTHTEGFRTIHTGRKKKADPDHDSLIALDAHHPNLITHLRDLGYTTCSFGKNHNVRWSVYREWFDEVMYDDYQHPAPAKLAAEPTPEQRRALFAGKISEDFPRELLPDHYNADKAIDFLHRHASGGSPRADGEKPFFMLLDFGWPHPAYRGCPPWFDTVSNEDIDVPPRPPLTEDTARIRRLYREVYGLDDLPESVWKTVVRAYQSMVAHSDQQIGRVLDTVQRCGLAENTIFIYSADHGDFAGEYGCVEKYDGMFYDCLVRVPLIVQMPGRLPGGRRFDQPVELLDLYPTLCDLLDIPHPPGLHGRSLLPLIEGKTDEHKKCVFSEGGLEPGALETAPSMKELGRNFAKHRVLVEQPVTMERAKMVVMGPYKLVWRTGGDHEFYDLDEDPAELENRYGQERYRDVIAEMREELIAWLIRTETDRPPIDELIA